MARPQKNNANYFSHDTEMRNDVKIKALRRRFSHMGYAAWNYLLEALTDAEDFRIKWEPINIELYAADFDMDAEQLTDIVTYCVKIELLRIDDGYLLCDNLIKRFGGLISKRRRERLSANDTLESPQVSDSDNDNNKEFSTSYRGDNRQKHDDNSTNNESPQVSDSDNDIVKKSKEKKSKRDYSSSGACAREGECENHPAAVEVKKEEEKDFFEIFFFRNFADPWKQTERFIAHNSARGWKGDRGAVFDTPEKRLSLARLWEQKDAPPGEKRFPDWFINLWKQAYALASDEDSDIGNGLVAAEMLDRRVRAETGTGNVRKITCGPNFARWYQAHAEQIAPIFRGVKMYTWS